MPGDAAVPGDTGVPCVPGFLDLCNQPVQSTALDITDARTIDTGRDSLCHRFTQPGGGDVCLVYVTSVSITSTGSLTAFGSRPLALASSSTMTIDGTLDAGSHGGQRGPAANTTGCSFASNPETDVGGGGGAAGGTFTLDGGNGGIGDSNNNGGTDGTASPGTHGPTTTISVLRGGCAGQTGGDEANTGGSGHGGRGGDSGGGLYLFARQSLTITGNVRATGAGGAGCAGMSGGGGGGTGGLVVIESASITISGTGQISANGGGGGQGGGKNFQNQRVPGNPGADGNLGTTAAAGGSGALGGDPGFGPGGAGGAIAAAANGTTGSFGGGGGGGAAGAIKLLSSQQQVSGTISPPPQ